MIRMLIGIKGIVIDGPRPNFNSGRMMIVLL